MLDSVQPEPTAEQLAAFVATHPPICGADDGTVPAGGTAEAGTGDGQGANGSSGNGLYPDLSNLTPDQRSLVEPHLKAMEGNVTRKFKEAADHRSQWEPYEQLGVHEQEPEVVDFLLNFYDEMQDPDRFKSWVQEQAESLGVTGNGEGPEGGDDLDLDGDGANDPEQMRSMMRELLQEEVGPLKQAQAQEQAERVQAEESAKLTSRLDELVTEAKLDEFSDEEREDVYTLAMRYPAEEEDPIGLAFQRYQQIAGRAESNLLDGKRDEPDPPQGPGGGADSGQKPIKSFADAEAMARTRFRESQAA